MANLGTRKRPVPLNRCPDFEKRIARCLEEEHAARKKSGNSHNGKKKISRSYHPFDPLSGEKQSASTVTTLLEEKFGQIREATDHLTDRCKKRIEKAWHVTSKMTATIAFFSA